MTIPTLGEFPPYPQRGSQFDNFTPTADAFLAYFPTFQSEVNASIGEMNATATQMNQDRQATEQAAQTATENAEQTALDRQQTGEDRQAAADSAQTAGARFASFDERYLGEKSADPTTDNQGDPLIVGALYFNTTGQGAMRVWNGTEWRTSYATVDFGDAPITSLKPGTLTTPKDYASTDGEGNIVKRNLADDVNEQLTDFEPDTIAPGAKAPDLLVGRYNATVYEITDSAAHTVDCSQYQGVYIGSGSPTITLTNIIQFPIIPNIGTNGQSVFTIVAENTNAFTITNNIRWPNNDAAPSLGDLYSVVALVFTGDYQILGSIGHTS